MGHITWHHNNFPHMLSAEPCYNAIHIMNVANAAREAPQILQIFFPICNEAKRAETVYSGWVCLRNKLKDMLRHSNASDWVR